MHIISSMDMKNRNTDIVNGPLFTGILRFAWPLMLANLLQITFHSADTLIIGRFAGQHALAAAGTAGPVTIFFMWGLNGLSAGANIIISRLIGRGGREDVRNSVFTAILIGIISGIIIMCIGIVSAGILMKMMSVPADIIADSVLYLRIFFLSGLPLGIYDFSAAALRSDGDTKTSTVYLALAGVLNVILNILFVTAFHLGIAGVAAATVISQCFAAALIARRLLSYEGIIRLVPGESVFDRQNAVLMLKSGIPSALQNQLFSFSNIIIQSSFNTFGSSVIAANTAALCVEDFCYVFVDALPQACATYTSQAFGAAKYERIQHILAITFIICGTGALLIGLGVYLNGPFLLSFFSNDAAVIAAGMYRLRYVSMFLFLNGLLDCAAASIRSIGYSALPALVTLIGVCGFRTAYILLWLPMHRDLKNLYLCFPYSWTLALLIQSCIWLYLYRKLTDQKN